MKLKIGLDGRTYEVDVEVVEEGASRDRGYPPPYAETAVPRWMPPVAAPMAAAAASGEGTVDESKVCRSPVAGIVTRINAQPGQQLERNDLIMVLEAMKMETSVTAFSAGKIKAVKVDQGDGVKVNQILVEIE